MSRRTTTLLQKRSVLPGVVVCFESFALSIVAAAARRERFVGATGVGDRGCSRFGPSGVIPPARLVGFAPRCLLFRARAGELSIEQEAAPFVSIGTVCFRLADEGWLLFLFKLRLLTLLFLSVRTVVSSCTQITAAATAAGVPIGDDDPSPGMTIVGDALGLVVL